MGARLLVGGVRIVGRHRRRIVYVDSGVLVRVVVVVILGIGAWWRGARIYGHIVVDVVIHRKIGKCGLRKRLCYHLASLVLQMRVVASGFFLCELCGIGQTLLLSAFDDGSYALVNFVTAIFLEIATDVAKQWNVTDGSSDEYQQGTSKNDDSTEGRYCQKRSRQGAVDKVSADVVPLTRDTAL